MRQHIEIPDAVFEVEVELDTSDAQSFQYSVDIIVGGVTVFTRTYHDDDARYDSSDYVYDRDEARAKTLTAFGDRLQALLQDD